MTRILLVTNDFPPTVGGIQSYLRDFADTLPPQDVVVFCSTQDEAAAEDWDERSPYKVVRWPRKVMLPTLATMRRMQEIIRAEDIDTVWFGAAAPLAVMAAGAKAAGAKKVVASTHGHEVGWSMIPGARQVLRMIAKNCDVITYIADYTLGRFRRAFGEDVHFEHLPSGVETQYFVPVTAQEKKLIKEQLGWDTRGPYIVCTSRLVARKGQDQLIKVMPDFVENFPDGQLVLVGGGSYEKKLRALVSQYGMEEHVHFAGRISDEDMLKTLQAADIFAMPARTRGGGLDVEGLGIVYLEAQACGIPVVAGDSGGAPETVTEESGVVVKGKDTSELLAALVAIANNPAGAKVMGRAGRNHVEAQWTWNRMGKRLRRILGITGD